MPETIIATVSRNQHYRRIAVAIGAAMVAFLAYSSVYAYRKPFTVATMDGVRFFGVSYQTLLIISQVIGYMLSKFAGIRFIAALKRKGRWKAAVTLVGIAWLSLLVFALIPAPYGMICLFVNGFMLGFLWGIIFSYVEGRRATDFIGTVMAISFIFAGGFTRTVAKWIMVRFGVSETWMPFMTGLLFILPFLFFVYLLERIPPPDRDDVRERTERLPMSKADRRNFLRQFSFGIAAITITYFFLTIIRDMRDNYMANIWNELGYSGNYRIFTSTETNTSLIVLAVMTLLALIRRNIEALRVIHLVIAGGFVLAGVSSWLFINGSMDGAVWMQLTGLGLYMSYIPFNCIFFERMIATFRIQGNVGFLIYIADAFGYLGSVVILLSKEFMQWDPGWPQFYSQLVVIGMLFSLSGIIVSWHYFNRKYKIKSV